MIDALLAASSYSWNPYVLPILIAASATLLLGIWVVQRERFSSVSFLFCVLTLTLSIWLFAFSVMYCSHLSSVALWWAKAAYLGVPFIPSAIYHFTVAVLGLSVPYRRSVWLSWLLSVFFAAAIITSDWLIGGLYHYWWGWYPRYGWLSVPYLTFFFGMMVVSLRHFWHAYRTTTPGTTDSRRVKTLLIAFGVMYTASIDYIAKYGIACYPFGYLPVLVFAILAAWSIRRYRLVEITPAIAAPQILQTMVDALLVIDPEGIVRIVNQAACRLFGFSESQLCGKPLSMMCPDLHAAVPPEAFKNTSSLKDVELKLASPGGTRTLSLSASSIANQRGQSTVTVWILRDITGRKQAEAALHETEERFRLLVEGVSDYAIYMLDPKGLVMSWNAAAERMKGYKASEIIGKHFSCFYMPEDVAIGKPELALQVAAAQGKFHAEGWRLRKDGSRFWADVALTALRDECGVLRGFAKVARDITRRKQTEAQLHQAHAELKRSHKALKEAQLQLIQAAKMESIGRLAAGVAHEVKNPLAVILQGLEFVADRMPKDEKSQRFLQYIRDAVYRADSVIRGLLEFSVPRSLELAEGPINDVIERALLLVKHELDRHHITVAKELGEDLPCVRLDRHKIEQVMVNLIMNAIQAMAAGGTITVRTYVKQMTTASHRVGSRRADYFSVGDRVVVAEVDDSGPGIPPHALSKIFDPFFTTKPTGQGTGLGLTVTRNIIEMHGGVIELRNREEGGVRASILLRAEGGEVDEQEASVDSGRRGDADGHS